jgi:superfamily I DNA/RNA helicase
MAKIIHPKQWRPVDVEDLEPAAWDVVYSHANRYVIAGPGAGKTELLAQRACYLLQTGQSPSPKRILAISFKRDAARNLRDRVKARCEADLAWRFDSYTFDAFSKGLLDRFWEALPETWRPTPEYLMTFPRDSEITAFLDEIGARPEVSTGPVNQTPRPNVRRFMHEYVLGSPLPLEPAEPSSFGELAAKIWWQQSLKGVDGKTRLTFPMVGRLAELLLRTNPKLLKALQRCYSHVFMDEFQDTTAVQYGLVLTAFQNSMVILTAVGDKKQQIMRWAGAMDDIFDRFGSDIGATESSLVSNYRSSPELVKIQHILARAIDQSYVPVESKVAAEISSMPCEVREYHDVERESQDLGSLILKTLEERNLNPRDIAILVRQRPTDYEPLIAEVLRSRGIWLRVEAQLQDLLAERLTGAILPFLRLGSVARSGQYWQICTEVAVALWGFDPEEDGHKVSKALARFHSKLRNHMQALPTQTSQTKQVVDMVLDYLGRANLVNNFKEYQQSEYLKETEDNLALYLNRSCQVSQDWERALDDFEGRDIVPMMTIHKSKSLEYDTIIFVGLDDQAWWNFARQSEEERSAFFVAFSRAKQWVVFTCCEQRGGKSGIASLYDLLHSAGVPSRIIE